MHAKEFKEKLKAALPEEHPLIDAFDEIDANGTEAIDSVVDVIEDWKRGIRDWSEVDLVIQQVKDN